MGRGRKLLIVSAVLLAGCVLAWPFRKTGNEKSQEPTRVAEATSPENTDGSTAPENTASRQPANEAWQLGSLSPHVAAKQASLIEARSDKYRNLPAASFDFANHPALTAPFASSPVTPSVPPSKHYSVGEAKLQSDSRPAYATPEQDRSFDPRQLRQKPVRHVVQNSDTLEKIAKRYLRDESRALEIFDLNRDLLDNPHLLPIAAELRLPADAISTID